MSETTWWFLDLSLVITYAGAVTFAVLAGVEGALRMALAIPLVVFFPGYAFLSIPYPDRGGVHKDFDEDPTGLNDPIPPPQGLSTVERIALSVVLSLVIVPTVALVSSVSPWGITLLPVLLGTGVVTIAFALLAIVARWRCPPDRRFSPASLGGEFLFRSKFGPGRRRDVTVFNVMLLISVVLLVGSVGYALANPPQPDGFTEFQVETEPVTGETEEMYESSYRQGETQPLTLSVTNQEHRDVEYTVIVLLQQVSYGDNGVTTHAEDELGRDAVTVPDGETRDHTVDITPTIAEGELRLLVLLYDVDPPENPSEDSAYRVLRLPIEVS